MGKAVIVFILGAFFSRYVITTTVRLIGGHHSWEGTVEIYYSAPYYSYGTLCDYNFNHNAAKVICRMLGYEYENALAVPGSYFGRRSGNIWAERFYCNGNEADITYCSSFHWNYHYYSQCTHARDAGVICNNIYHRLIGGSGNFEGVVDLNHNGNWGTFCGRRSFTDKDAKVVCKMSGFSSGVAVKGSVYGHLNYGTIWSGNLGCNGNETDVRYCSGYSTAFRSTTACNHSENVGVICEHTSIRLVGGSVPSEGRVEILHNNVWGSVCGKHFTSKDADVICHMAGYNSSALTIQRNVTGGTGPVWLESLNCTGKEADIQFCHHGSWDNHTCDHTNDISVKCKATEIRLYGGSGSWDGSLQIKMEGSWKTVCDRNFAQSEARVVCNMLGYNATDVKPYIYKSNYFGDNTSGVIDSIKCKGNESDISQCVSSFQSSCSSTYAIGLKCVGVEVRLADGPHEGEGRLEVLHNGQWGTVCDSDWDDNDATVVCKMLSSYPFESNVKGKAVSGSYFGRGTGHVWLSDVNCQGHEPDITNCSLAWSMGVNCDHSNDAGVVCSYPYQKRLSNGRSQSQGRVEFLQSGTWYSYCDDGWNISDAKVICREIGYWSTNPAVSYNSTYGNGRSNYVVRPQCNGSEGSFEMCRMDKLFKSSTCSASNSVGVECQPVAATTTNVRIVDGPGPWYGRLEIKSNSVWGSVCHDSWDVTNALRACESMGYKYLSSDVSSFEIERGLSPMHSKSVTCNPSDLNIGLCKLDFNISDCANRNSKAVGLDCSGGINVTLSNTYTGEVIFHTMENGTMKQWSVCYNAVDSNAAKAICSMIGYQNTSPNRSAVSSSNPVLFTNLSCAGWESHVMQCDTLRTGPSCGQKAAVNCFGCVRTFNTATGSVQSRGYPNYPSNTDCLIVINKQSDTPLKLDFHDLDLAGDGDFVEIKNGRGKQLGYFTTNVDVPYLVSKDGFYIRLNSNNADNGRGFNMSWSPLVITDAVHMGCASKGWNVSVNATILRHLYPDTGVSQIKLAEQFCTGEVFGDLVVFQQSYTKCSTTSKTSNETLEYNNKLVYPESRTPFPIIVRGYRWKWKSLETRRREARLCMLYKIHHDIVAIDKTDTLVIFANKHQSRTGHFYQVPSCRCDYRKESFLPRTVRDWNTLPPDIVSVGSLEAFKSQVAQLFI
ncbi:deleted in malignant brain tumors 1 protein-like [Mercenaria mercenaria]|uniref:deleted in malignant brain tumors 1 protein-like n=1 Tax=Mercenaria mercenaria TaxID=6596 RepID=UPI00234F53FD|nr:deleted in malignant brain tumors 1 protein-like [Mercenaria mercenaria]